MQDFVRFMFALSCRLAYLFPSSATAAAPKAWPARRSSPSSPAAATYSISSPSLARFARADGRFARDEGVPRGTLHEHMIFACKGTIRLPNLSQSDCPRRPR